MMGLTRGTHDFIAPKLKAKVCTFSLRFLSVLPKIGEPAGSIFLPSQIEIPQRMSLSMTSPVSPAGQPRIQTLPGTKLAAYRG